MSTTSRRNRRSFRPELGGFPLEERVVMSGTPAWATILRGLGAAPGSPSPTGASQVTARQLQSVYREQIQAAQQGLGRYVNDQVATLYAASNLGADGRPTQQALGEFSSNITGALNATAYGVSSQAALLPGADRRLVSGIQEAFLGTGPTSLATQIGRQVGSGRGLASQAAFQNALGRQVNAAFANVSGQVSNYLRIQPLSRLSVDQATGRRIPLSQYLGDQAARQINNTFGSLANSVGANARSALFDASGGFNAQAANAFQQQYGNALNTAAYQANNVLSILPNSSAVRSQFQAGFFGAGDGTGTGAGSANFFNALTGALPAGTGSPTTPFTTDAFDSAFQSGFASAYQNFTGPLNTFLNVPASGAGPTLPSGFFQAGASFPSVFGSQFTGPSFNNGFNNGFATTGSGFPGFGSVPSGFNTAFGTGFNNLVTSFNGQSGVTGPIFNGGAGGVGTGTIGGGTGVVDPNNGLGVTGPNGGLGGVVDPNNGLVGTGSPGLGTTGVGTIGTGSTGLGTVGAVGTGSTGLGTVGSTGTGSTGLGTTGSTGTGPFGTGMGGLFG